MVTYRTVDFDPVFIKHSGDDFSVPMFFHRHILTHLDIYIHLFIMYYYQAININEK